LIHFAEDRGLGIEAAARGLEEDGQAAVLLVGRGEVQVAVAIEIRSCHREGNGCAAAAENQGSTEASIRVLEEHGQAIEQFDGVSLVRGSEILIAVTVEIGSDHPLGQREAHHRGRLASVEDVRRSLVREGDSHVAVHVGEVLIAIAIEIGELHRIPPEASATDDERLRGEAPWRILEVGRQVASIEVRRDEILTTVAIDVGGLHVKRSVEVPATADDDRRRVEHSRFRLQKDVRLLAVSPPLLAETRS
jgi:hypothetical protein